MPDLFEADRGSYREGGFGGDFFSVDEERDCEGLIHSYDFRFRHFALVSTGLLVRNLGINCRFVDDVSTLIETRT